ncbi:MAG: LptF/LptG family permease [Robiginitomaculum sp.]|nr:LptF/LptG family permease [Robiginitomaculum sp.]
MGQLNQYIMRSALRTIGGLILFALAVLLLERLLRIFEVVSASTRPAGDATQMVINLLPHYLGIAIPMALMLGTIITIDRMSRSSELTSAFGSGISLFHMTKPFILISIVLMGFNLLLEGYMQPLGRYGYREVVHSVGQKSFAAVLREGKFTKVGNTTFYVGPGGGPIFIYEKLKNDGLRITTASKGALIVRDETEQPVLQLSNGDSFQITPEKLIKGQLGFEISSVAGSISGNTFRARGNDERELTSSELYKNRDGKAFTSISASTNNAALHLRMARVYLLFLIPFIAVPFGINYGRNPSSAGIVVGIVSLVTLQKALEFGQKMGARGDIAPWMGIWPLMGVVTLSAIFLFSNSAVRMGQPPLATLSIFTADVIKDIRKGVRALIPFSGSSKTDAGTPS